MYEEDTSDKNHLIDNQCKIYKIYLFTNLRKFVNK